MAMAHSSPALPFARLSRRTILGALPGLGALLLPTAGRAGSIRAIYPAARVALPAMGPSFRREVRFPTSEKHGTIVIEVKQKALFLVIGNGNAYRYDISVGRQGFGWSGTVKVGAKREWPDWHPPAAMRKRDPELPASVPPGPYNPLGARALYLFRNGRDTLFRIHGTNHPDGIGFDGTSGCFRLTNTDILDLFKRVKTGTKVVVQ